MFVWSVFISLYSFLLQRCGAASCENRVAVVAAAAVVGLVLCEGRGQEVGGEKHSESTVYKFGAILVKSERHM